MVDKLGRKTIWTITALGSFLTIMIINPTIDPFQLGMGIGLILSPTSVANAIEHKAKNGV